MEWTDGAESRYIVMYYISSTIPATIALIFQRTYCSTFAGVFGKVPSKASAVHTGLKVQVTVTCSISLSSEDIENKLYTENLPPQARQQSTYGSNLGWNWNACLCRPSVASATTCNRRRGKRRKAFVFGGC